VLVWVVLRTNLGMEGNGGSTNGKDSFVGPLDTLERKQLHSKQLARDTSLGSPGPSAADLHNPLTKPCSNTIREWEWAANRRRTTAYGNGKYTLFSRPGILRGHHIRAPSSLNKSQRIQGASFRALQFQSSASNLSLSAKARRLWMYMY
jgi:hypothetical protein